MALHSKKYSYPHIPQNETLPKARFQRLRAHCALGTPVTVVCAKSKFKLSKGQIRMYYKPFIPALTEKKQDYQFLHQTLPLDDVSFAFLLQVFQIQRSSDSGHVFLAFLNIFSSICDIYLNGIVEPDKAIPEPDSTIVGCLLSYYPRMKNNKIH